VRAAAAGMARRRAVVARRRAAIFLVLSLPCVRSLLPGCPAALRERDWLSQRIVPRYIKYLT